jgi:hypothetical protein
VLEQTLCEASGDVVKAHMTLERLEDIDHVMPSSAHFIEEGDVRRVDLFAPQPD